MAFETSQAKYPAPKNIFESIFYGVDVVNDNVVALSKGLEELGKQLASLEVNVATIQKILNQPAPEPNIPGAEAGEKSK